MSSSRRRFPVRHPVVVVDIGCSCRRPKLSSLSSFSSFFSFASSRPRNPKPAKLFSPSTTTTTTTNSLWDTTAGTSTTSTNSVASPYEVATPPSHAHGFTAERRTRAGRRKKKKRAAGESVAVVKDSSEPYLDFKESMLQMIVENEMYGWDDLNDLLHRLLSLNSPDHHPLILRAFADIWNGILAPSDD